MAGVPLIVTGLVRWYFGVPLSAFRPYINDEVTYWHQSLTFSQVGFSGGYYTLGETTNPSGFTPFGPHGPGFPVLYGLVAAALGWHTHSIVVTHLASIAAAAWSCAAFARLSIARTWLLGLLLATFWPLLFWAPTSMQEGLHYAGAIAVGGCVAGVLRTPRSTTAHVAGWVLLSVLAFVKPSWLVLMPVWALAASWTKRPVARTASVAVSIALSAGILAAYSRSIAPFGSGFFFLRAATSLPGLRAIADNLAANLRMTATVSDYSTLEVLHRVQYWTWLLASAVLGAWAWRARTADGARRPDVPYLLAGAAAASLALVAMLLLYTLTNWAEHRVLSAFLLFAAVVGVAAPGRLGPALGVALIASNLAMTGPFLREFEESRRDNYVWDRRGLRGMSDALRGHVVYRAGASRWCNTLLTSQFPPYLIAVPAGIGLSVVREPDQMALPPKSRYLLLDEPALADFARPLRTQELARLPYGTLYRNLEAECE